MPASRSPSLWLKLADGGCDLTPGGRPYPGGLRREVRCSLEGRHARISEIGDSAQRRLRTGGEKLKAEDERSNKPVNPLKKTRP